MIKKEINIIWYFSCDLSGFFLSAAARVCSQS